MRPMVDMDSMVVEDDVAGSGVGKWQLGEGEGKVGIVMEEKDAVRIEKK